MKFTDIKSLENFVASRLNEITSAVSESMDIFSGEVPAALSRCVSFANGASPGLSYAPELTAESTCRDIDRERDLRIDSGFTFGVNTFQSRPSDRENIMGAAQLAMGYLGAGGDPASLRWANPDADFVWIAADNRTVPMTAMDVVGMFQAGVAFKSALTFYARAMKDAVIAAEDPASVPWRDNWP